MPRGCFSPVSPSPLVQFAKAERTGTAFDFDAMCEEHAPKLKVIRDIAVGAARNIGDNDYFKFRKMWIYFGNISPALFDLQPTGKGKAKQLFPGFCAEALKHSRRTGSGINADNRHFEVINIAERAAAGGKKIMENDFDTVLRMLDTPHGGQITRPQIHAFRRFIHGSSKPELDKHLKFDDRTDALISVLRPDNIVTCASSYVDVDTGWTLAAFNDPKRPEAAQLPNKVKRFIEFLDDLKIVTMKPLGGMWYRVPQRDGVIFLSANVNACLDATPIDNLKKIINHDLNCTGAIVRIICGDEKMGGVGLSLNHIGVSVLADVPDSVTAMDQAARRGNRMCSHRGLPTLPTKNTPATRNLAPVSEWTVRLVILASGMCDKTKLQKLKELQGEMDEVEKQLTIASTHTLFGASHVSNNIPLSHSKLIEAVQSHNNPSKINNVRSELRRLYRLNRDNALLLLQRMLRAAATKVVNNRLANADAELIAQWVRSVQRTKSEEDFNALIKVAFYAKKRNQNRDLTTFLTHTLQEAAKAHLARYVTNPSKNVPRDTWAHGLAVRVFKLIKNTPNSPRNNGNPFFAAAPSNVNMNASSSNPPQHPKQEHRNHPKRELKKQRLSGT